MQVNGSQYVDIWRVALSSNNSFSGERPRNYFGTRVFIWHCPVAKTDPLKA